MRLDNCDNEVLLLGGRVYLNILAELCELDLWALGHAAELAAFLIDCPLSIVLDALLGDFNLGDLDPHDSSEREDPKFLDLDRLLVLWLYLNIALFDLVHEGLVFWLGP